MPTKIKATRKRTVISNPKGLSDAEIIGFLGGLFDLPPSKKAKVKP